MTNFEAKENALKLLDEILELTNEVTIRNFIDEPIEKVLSSFSFEHKDPVTYKKFIHFIGSFVRVLYEQIPWCLQKPSKDQACAEAMHILEAGYQSSQSRGYDAAFSDARNPLLDGIEFVLFQLSEIIKARLRMKYTRWVYVSRIECTDWHTRCSMAEILIARWKPFLPSNILVCSPAQLADHIPDLIDMLGSADNMVSEMLGPIWPGSFMKPTNSVSFI
jgi:hypothetical protein